MSSQSKNGKPDINDLLRAAHDNGTLSSSSLDTLTIVDLGAEIQSGMGVCVDDVDASEVVLLTLMPDDSGSIDSAGNTQAVRDGHNMVIDLLQSTRQRDAILAHTRYLNGHVLFPYRPVAQAERMTASNYNPNLGTPLYDQSVVLLGSVLAKAQHFADNGVVARTITLIITDGGDAHSVNAKAHDVASLVRDMTRTETHIVAAMGLCDGETDFRAVFKSMGIAERWILTPSSDPAEIRRAFQVFSQSALRASQGANFSRAVAGGFVN